MTEDHMESRPRRGFFGAFRHAAPASDGADEESVHESTSAPSIPPEAEPESDLAGAGVSPPIGELEALLQAGPGIRPPSQMPGPEHEPSAARVDAVASVQDHENPVAVPGSVGDETPAHDGSHDGSVDAAESDAAESDAAESDADGASPEAFVGTALTPRATSDRPVPKLQGEPERDLASRDAAPPLELPRVIALANQKGGVGKTTTAVNLGAGLAELGFRVLVVDLDPQGNATTGLGINPRDVEASIYDVIMSGASPEDCIEPTSLKNLFVLPATIDLAGAEIELVPAFSRELKLKRALDSVKPDYDVILIDCPPSLGLLTINGLAAADDVIVPIQCEYYALEGLGQLLRNVSLVRSGLNPTLDVRGIVLTMYDARTKLADQVETEVRTHFGAKVYRTIVPRTVRLGEAPSFGQPIIVFDPSSRGATAYRDLAKEVSSGATRRSG